MERVFSLFLIFSVHPPNSFFPDEMKFYFYQSTASIHIFKEKNWTSVLQNRSRILPRSAKATPSLCVSCVFWIFKRCLSENILQSSMASTERLCFPASLASGMWVVRMCKKNTSNLSFFLLVHSLLIALLRYNFHRIKFIHFWYSACWILIVRGTCVNSTIIPIKNTSITPKSSFVFFVDNSLLQPLAQEICSL